MTETIYKNYSLKELCVTYLEFLNLWHTGMLYSNRAELHDEICERLGITIYDRSDDIPLNRILHNLDKEIGYVIGVEYDKKDIEKMGKRLCNKLKKRRIQKDEMD